MTKYSQNKSRHNEKGKESFAAETVGGSDPSQMNKAQTSSPKTPVQGGAASRKSADGKGVTSSKDMPAKTDRSAPNEVTVPGLELMAIDYHPIGATADQTSESQAADENPHRALDCDFACQGLAAEIASSAILQSIAPTTDDSDGQEGAIAGGLNGGARFLDSVDNLLEGIHRRRGERRAKRRARRESGVLTLTGSDGIQEVVNNGDERSLVDGTTMGPWSGIVQLNILGGNGRQYVGTGWLIAPRTIITAGHCVFMHDAGGWAREITASAGRNGDARPYDARVSVNDFSAASAWIDFADRSEDYGVIFLDKPFSLISGESPFIFSFAAKDDSELTGEVLNLSGYPAGDPINGKDSTFQWFHARTPIDVTSNTIVYDTDTSGGQSGSPCWHYANDTGERVVVGIHTNGFPYANSATRITIEMEGEFEEWRAAGL